MSCALEKTDKMIADDVRAAAKMLVDRLGEAATHGLHVEIDVIDMRTFSDKVPRIGLGIHIERRTEV